MWTRKELKERGKSSFQKNYWKCVLVALIITFIASGSSGGFSGGNSFSNAMTQRLTSGKETSSTDTGNPLIGEVDDNTEFNIDDPTTVTIEDENGESSVAFVITMAIMMIIVCVVVFAIVLVVDVFLINPMEMGCSRFFLKNLEQPAKISNILYGFDHGYKNIVTILFFKDLYIVLWAMLFIIPGIIKAYEYRMIPYLLSENPEMSKEEVFDISKKMMKGNKWKAFVLDLSFIGWDILSVFTCGLLSMFYVAPYQNATNAALYEALKAGGSDDAEYADNTIEEEVQEAVEETVQV